MIPENESPLERERLSDGSARHVLARLVLIITIISMVLISIRPFAFRKIFLLVATLLCLSSAICFADSLFMSMHSKPRYGQLTRSTVAPVSIPERILQPLVFVPRQSPEGAFAQDTGWILSGIFVHNPVIDWSPDRLAALGDRSESLSTYAERGR